MNSVVLLCLTLALTLVSFLIVYLTPYFSKKKIRHGKFDLLQFLNMFFTPILMIPLFYFFKTIVSSSPEQRVIFIPRYVSDIGFMLILYMFVLGNGIHSVSVILSKHMKDLQKHRVWEINEFFHNKFSHILTFVSAVLILSSFAVMEINHPTTSPLSGFEVSLLIFSGIIAGVIVGMGSVEGSIPREMFFLIYSFALLFPFVFFKLDLDFRFFPYTTFVETIYITAVIVLSFYKYKKKNFKEIVPHYFFDS
jgi:hypothetical protein